MRCERPECTRDDECAFNLACKNERCEDPCNCGVGAQCRVDNHRAQCRCPPGYSGNPLVSCVLEEPKVAPQCTMDADCTSKLACFNGECKNPCAVTQPCGANAICSVVDTLPLRTMICQCEPGYVGDADVGCRKGRLSTKSLVEFENTLNACLFESIFHCSFIFVFYKLIFVILKCKYLFYIVYIYCVYVELYFSTFLYSSSQFCKHTQTIISRYISFSTQISLHFRTLIRFFRIRTCT